jgi:hypothetical protein
LGFDNLFTPAYIRITPITIRDTNINFVLFIIVPLDIQLRARDSNLPGIHIY